jgi:hypothetical protein
MYKEIEIGMCSWESQGLDKAGLEKYFADLLSKYQELREYVNNYAYCLPNAYFASYQTRLDQCIEAFNVQKGLAMPKKGF